MGNVGNVMDVAIGCLGGGEEERFILTSRHQRTKANHWEQQENLIHWPVAAAGRQHEARWLVAAAEAGKLITSSYHWDTQ